MGTDPLEATNASSHAPSLIGIFEKVLAGAAAAAAIAYVLLNALYVEFYDDFGVRPEDVGLDRVTVLGRAAWLVLLGGLVVTAGLGIGALATRRSRKRDANERQGAGKDPAQYGPLGVHIPSTAAVVLSVGLLVLTFVVLRLLVHFATLDAERGERVGGIGWQIEIVDVRALPARVTWVSDAPVPLGLERGAEYLYLGYGERVVALIDCSGSTLLLQPSDVIVEVLSQDHKFRSCP